MTTAVHGRLAAVLVMVLSAATCTATGCAAGADHPAAVPAAPPSSATTSPSAPTAPPSPATVLRQWEAVAGDHFTLSAEALQQVSEASAAGDESGLRSGCQQLHDANSIGLQRDLPTPDPKLTAELQRMIDDMNTATHACLRFILSRNTDDAGIYQDYLARAVDHLQRAKVILDADLAEK